MTKVHVVISSINELNNLFGFKEQLEKTEPDIEILVVDEGDERIRERNRRILENQSTTFYGPDERKGWFRERFDEQYEKYLSVIPERCHAETSFGFLAAYEGDADVVIELDDDVFPQAGSDLVNDHLNNLHGGRGATVGSACKWYNTLDNLVLDTEGQIFPRGHPYRESARRKDYRLGETDGGCVLNMGLWTNVPDLDALTILYHGGFDGRPDFKSLGIRRERMTLDKGTYFSVCSMNTSFKVQLVPAFYQLYMKTMGIDRFDDIWSGIIVKKIADHLSDPVCIGAPVLVHNKRPRDTFVDLRAELEGMAINESLWSIIDEVDLEGKDYYCCYGEVAEGIEERLDRLRVKLHRDFLEFQISKMRLWLDLIDKLA